MPHRLMTLMAAILVVVVGCGFTTAPPSVSTQPPLETPSPFPAAPLPLDSYPRPPGDNGLGIHWSTHLYAQSHEATDYFVNELVEMNIKWVKVLNDSTRGREFDYTIDQLVAHDMMPMIRIYQQCNTPYDPDALDEMVRHFVEKGVYYYDLYNEPNLPGEPGGWCSESGDPEPAYLAEIWADAARTIYLAGGYPGLPSFFAPDHKDPTWRESFFYQFFDALVEQGNKDVLYFSWASIHNYNVNHPPTYPFDEVNQTGRLLTEAEIERYNLSPTEVDMMNLNRQVAGILRRRPLTYTDSVTLNISPEQINAINGRFEAGELMGFTLYDDSTAFLHHVAFRNQFYDLFGFDIPMISTEGGATKGSAEDPRYPEVDGETVAEWTLWSADYMLDDAPDYYFTTMTWLLAQSALEYEEPVWEVNAWYHDREGDQEPVVDALKTRPRLAEVRQTCASNDLDCWLARVAPQPDRVSLADYPRPPNDNGRGVHWSPTTNPLHSKVTNYFIAELEAMHIKWVKFMQPDIPEVRDPYLVEQFVAHDIMPVVRVYLPFNDRYANLPEFVVAATERGIPYFELYNEPNIAGPAGGWRDGEPINVARMTELWILAAQEVHHAGGHPSLLPLAAGGTMDDKVFLRQYLDEIRARGQADLMVGAWIPLHNYFFNHPLDYPTDPVNRQDLPLTAAEIAARNLTPEQVESINYYRRISHRPFEEGGYWLGDTIDEDSNGFRKFEAYANIFYSRFGYHIPVIGTEGGLVLGTQEDPRYPPVNETDLVERTLGAYHALLDDAPPYFFVQMPWLLANSAGEHADPRFENAAWYKDRRGLVLPVVPALKADPRRFEVREFPTD